MSRSKFIADCTGNEPSKFEAFICILYIGAANDNSGKQFKAINTRMLFLVDNSDYPDFNNEQIMKRLLIDSIGINKSEIERVKDMSLFNKVNMQQSNVYKYDLSMIKKMGIKQVHHFGVLLSTRNIFMGSPRYTAIMRSITMNDLFKLFTDVFTTDQRMKEYNNALVCLFPGNIHISLCKMFI